jgi:hypothetical protein
MAEGKCLALLPLNIKRERGLTEPCADPELEGSQREGATEDSASRGGPTNQFLCCLPTARTT